MKSQIPIYIHAAKDPDSGVMGYICAPLFSEEPRTFDVNLSRAMSKLAKRYKPELDRMGELQRHDALHRALFNPDLDSKILKMRLDLTHEVVRTRMLFVTMPMFGRRVAFSPSERDVWFEYDSNRDLEYRAIEVLTEYYRRACREARKNNAEFSVPSLVGQAWVATLDVDVANRQEFSPKDANPLAALWEDRKLNGAAELNKVGRCLDWLYPDGLKHAVLREDEVERLDSALASDAYRPIALVGPRLCGKTSIIHEYIRRRVSQRESPFGGKYWHWRISPQRLISGMSYVGQWESRLLAILSETRRRGHVLVFDNFLGLFEAGKTSCSELSVADVLRGHILRRHVRVVTEMNVEQWGALQERDRGLADQFQVIRVAPTNERDTLRILLKEQRELEHEFRCEFGIDAIPAIVEIHRRYDRMAAFPGKAAGFMRRAASKTQQKLIDAAEAYRAFSNATGVSYGLLNSQSALPREIVVAQLQSKVVGQAEGVQAAADAVMLAKAGLNDPSKPIATLLFLGPTGVGKTQCAKTLAAAMFSDESRLIRFDMNEYGGFAGAARLIGSRQDPDGLLTAAVRRQPYSVILLDEIEKAHRDVFDLLLQVLGEGRLTDSRGRTADFTNTVIVMTSNLGVREVGRTVGLKSDEQTEIHGYEKAARRFFRPEFFNRIDRIVPFAPLSQTDMRRILELTLGDLLEREGLVSRRAAVRIDADAMNHLVRRGYHPKLGARALKRTVESDLGQPMARQLAQLSRDTATLLVIDLVDNQLEALVYPFVEVERVKRHEEFSLDAVLPALEAFCQRMREQLDSIRPTGGITAGQLTPEQLRYFAIQEQLQETVDAVEELSRAHAKKPAAVHMRTHPNSRMATKIDGDVRSLRDARASYDLEEYRQETEIEVSRTTKQDDDQRPLRDAVRRAALLETLWTDRESPDRAVVIVRPTVRFDTLALGYFQSVFRQMFEERLGYDLQVINTSEQQGAGQFPVNGFVFGVSGVGVWPLLKMEAGVHLFEMPGGRLLPYSVELFSCQEGGELDAVARYELERQRAEWLARRSDSGDNDVFRPNPVVRRYQYGKEVHDCRTGKRLAWVEDHELSSNFLLDALPLPEELRAIVSGAERGDKS